MYSKPDSIIPGENITWRQKLEEYNRTSENSPKFLHKAWQLYKHQIYEMIKDRFEKNLFILSAGWGLVRSDYLLPHYDITFSQNAKRCNRRRENDIYSDFNQLKDEELEDTDIIYFLAPLVIFRFIII